MRFTSLLLLLAFCTCVRAQQRQPASLIVTVGPDNYEVYLSSPHQYETRRFVSRISSRRDNNRFRGYKWIDMESRYDLRGLQRLQDSLQRAGWQLVDTEHSIAVTGAELLSTFQERFIYHYQIPATPPPALAGYRAEGLENYIMEMENTGQSANGTVDLRLSMYRRPSDNDQVIAIEQIQGNRQLVAYRKGGVNLLPTESASRLEEATIAGPLVTLTYRTPGGEETYVFIQQEEEYYLMSKDGFTTTTVSLADFSPLSDR